ncbi:NAD(+) diphosphatase [Polymorphum gilvum]|uniref:NAD(+) diphosphatase n=1 Tax=Polymorphum gilvum (strain LMG 25793 / CGMCC 1.9160 / SL003B-26A1) TaxID=991905 RepID=F2IVI2_POLGS|nr:NAD(+) diphosphatase [Polymorphum gilvum]ADZ72700.1 NADH pyrophosphatase zinc ribbon domain family [Polymorphum gilvum SL003B-26A1]
MAADAIVTAGGDMSFVVNPLDRCSERRGDADWLAGLLARPDAAFVVSTAGRIVLDVAGAPSVRHARARADALGFDPAEAILLGLEDGRPLFACASPLPDVAVEAVAGLELIDLRTLALRGVLPPADLGALAQTRALVHWHLSHRFCSACGQPSVMREAGYRRDCPSCAAQHFPRTDPVVIMLITDGDKVLLGRPPRLAEGIFTTLAGFMEPGETIEDAVRRETYEEARIRVGRVDLVANQPWPFPANLMLGCRGEALDRDIVIGQDELEACRWCSRDEVRQMMAGSHPLGHRIPPPISIAHHLIATWVAEG